MSNYLSSKDAIDDMHQKGYTSDFQLVGNDLFWIQEKIFVRAGDFSILECHHPCNETDTILFGIVTHGYNAKGILMNHYRNYTAKTPPVLNKKLAEMYARSEEEVL